MCRARCATKTTTRMLHLFNILEHALGVEGARRAFVLMGSDGYIAASLELNRPFKALPSYRLPWRQRAWRCEHNEGN